MHACMYACMHVCVKAEGTTNVSLGMFEVYDAFWLHEEYGTTVLVIIEASTILDCLCCLEGLLQHRFPASGRIPNSSE